MLCPQLRSRVVVVKYDRKPLSNKTLFAFAERFGCLREHLILKNKAFLEMSTHEEALDVVNYYKQHPASLYGKSISFYLSQTLMFIEVTLPSPVVFFSNLPREDEKKKELLTIAERFGVVEKHLFLTDQVLVPSLTLRDASSRKSGKANSTSSGTGTRTSSKTTLSKSSTSRSKEDKKREEKEEEKKKEEEKEEKKVKAEPEEEEEEEEKEVSGVMEGGEDGEEQAATDGEGEEPEGAESVNLTVEESEDAQQEEEEEEEKKEEKVRKQKR
uniref:RRM domain-containing protein n=1 Tax=Neolamprologus brichardi TaxID=32507 RepID=A0A3Q4H6G9_NEOBR